MSQPAAQPFGPDVDLENDDDSYLLYYMSEAGRDRARAEAALAEFVNRHWDLLVGFCLKERFETFGKSAEDFVNETFLKAFEGAGTFAPRAGANAERIARDVQNWLFTILKRVFFDARRRIIEERLARKGQPGDEKEAEPVEVHEVLDFAAESPRQTKREVVSARRKTLTLQFIATLSERDRAIFIQTQDYIDPATGSTEVPKEELKALVAQFGIPADHIRVYRQRILVRLSIFIIAAELSPS